MKGRARPSPGLHASMKAGVRLLGPTRGVPKKSPKTASFSVTRPFPRKLTDFGLFSRWVDFFAGSHRVFNFERREDSSIFGKWCYVMGGRENAKRDMKL